MAKIEAPFHIKGTLEDLNFYVQSGENYLRLKGKSGVTKEQFAKNPIFDRIRQHSSEFRTCVKKSFVFRTLAKTFYDQAKEVSFAGRVNQLLFEIISEDTENPIGSRTIEKGLQSEHLEEIMVGFEGNKNRTLKKVLQKNIQFNWSTNQCNWKQCHPEKDIVWPEIEANQIHLQLAIANWNCKEDTFENQYSNEIILQKKDEVCNLEFNISPLQSKNLWIAYFFIGFSNQERRKTKPLHKKWNTATIIGIQNYE